MCVKKLKEQAKFFFTASWMFFAIYILLLELQDVQLEKDRMFSNSEGEDQSLLYHLGFVEEPKLYPQAYHYLEEKEWPVFALALQSKDLRNLVDFLISFRKFYLDHRLVIFAVDLSFTEKQLTIERCYCQVRDVQWQLYPPHLQKVKFQGYLPLLIQETLQEFGSVFWCDISMRFTNASIKPHIFAHALSSGIIVWPRDKYPTSTFTHPNLYRHLNINQSDYYFQQMVYPVPGLFINTEKLHHNVMMPWIKCVAQEQCLSPKGAQYYGCQFNARPKFKYAGCHRYSISALNIILGQMFRSENVYTTHQDLFTLLPESEISFSESIKSFLVSIY